MTINIRTTALIRPPQQDGVPSSRSNVNIKGGSNRSGSGLSNAAKEKLAAMEVERKKIRLFGKWDTCN